jgi:hypothetical protein
MMKMIKLLAGASLAPALLLAQTVATGWIAAPGSVNQNRTEGQQGPVMGKPFSGTEVRRSVQTLSDGTRVEKSDTSAYYRDDKGRVRSEGKNIALIFDPVAGFNYQLDLNKKTYTKTPVPSNLISYSLAVIGDGTWSSGSSGKTTGNAGQGNIVHTRTINGQPVSESKPVTEDLQTQMINGVRARGTRITTTIPMGAFGNDREMKVVNERWSSDDLRVLVKSGNSDPRFGESTYELVNVVQAVPAPALFQVPADFTERAVNETHPLHTVHHE